MIIKTKSRSFATREDDKKKNNPTEYMYRNYLKNLNLKIKLFFFDNKKNKVDTM